VVSDEAYGSGSATAVMTIVGPGRSLTFTDAPLAERRTIVKAAHFTELRERIGELRAPCGLPPSSWTDLAIVPAATPLKAVHSNEPRTALAEAYVAAAGRLQPIHLGRRSGGRRSSPPPRSRSFAPRSGRSGESCSSVSLGPQAASD
jgi:hypothetical protein